MTHARKIEHHRGIIISAMNQNKATNNVAKKFLGIEVPPDLTRRNFFFLYFFYTVVVGLMALIQHLLINGILPLIMDLDTIDSIV